VSQNEVWLRPAIGRKTNNPQIFILYLSFVALLNKSHRFPHILTLAVGAMSRIKGRMNAQQYIDILTHCLLLTLDNCAEHPDMPPRTELMFQRDNDPKHRSRLASVWFEDEGIKVMQRPAQSPDLNPIEHLWVHLKRKLSTYSEAPGGVFELWQRVRGEWKDITAETCQSLIEGMPRRVEAVIRVEGDQTKY